MTTFPQVKTPVVITADDSLLSLRLKLRPGRTAWHGGNDQTGALCWLLGRCPSTLVYPEGSPELEEMKVSPGAQRLRDEFYRRGCLPVQGFQYSTFLAAFETIVNPFTADLSSTAFQVGGFDGATATPHGDGTVTFCIQNTAGFKSFSYHQGNNMPYRRGPMANVYQTFCWAEQIDLCKCNQKMYFPVLQNAPPAVVEMRAY